MSLSIIFDQGIADVRYLFISSMQKYILIVIAVVITVFLVFGMRYGRKPSISGGISTVAPTQISPTSAVENRMTGEDSIRIFIHNINEKKIPEAIAMMDTTLVASDSDRQQYGVVFNSFSTITIQTIEPFEKEDWKEGLERYRVHLRISMKKGQQTLWDEGENIRWITVVKQQDTYKIHEIATGP
jgi:hypothetical protein